MLLLALPCHNTPLLSFSTLLLNSSFTLAAFLVAQPHVLPLFPLSSSTFFSVLLPSQGVLVSLLAVPFVVLPIMTWQNG